MIKLKNKTIDDFGNVILTDEALMEELYRGMDLVSLHGEKTVDVTKHNEYSHLFSTFPEIPTQAEGNAAEHHALLQNQWLIPKKYQNFDVEDYLFGLCETDEERDRVEIELERYNYYCLYPVLRCLIYLVDFMRTNKIVWGVGRGSSCASYCLFLIGIHKVNSLQYKLNFAEFLT